MVVTFFSCQSSGVNWVWFWQLSAKVSAMVGWQGDRVELILDMTPRVVRSDHRIDAVRGCVAVQRGPEVLALESVDLPPSWGLSADR